MKHAVIIILWISVLVTAAFLRFDHLGKRPFHPDEATGARIAARLMESGTEPFDPTHFHGPLQADLAVPWCRLHGETRWQEMTKGTLRTLPAIAGTLLVLLPLWWRRRAGDAPMLLAAALLATSPLLVYYSRMFIHESLLVLFGMMALLALTRKPRWGIPGLLLGLMFATKESFAISVIAWTAAGLLVAWENRRNLDRKLLAAAWRDYRLPAAVSLLVAALTAIGFYTDGFRHPQGAIDAVRTYFMYKTGAGHDKPFGYYLQLLALPQKSAGVWWFGTPLLGLALCAWAATFRRGPEAPRCRPLVRFIAYAAAGHLLIYSLIAYKTPWLVCLTVAHLCLLAGFALSGFANRRLPSRIALAVLAAACLVTQFGQARLATGRYATDARNPYAYVPTRDDVEKLESWLMELRRISPPGALEPVAVIGVDYWPLPWYLRAFDQIGYWRDPPADLAKLPLVFALPETTESVMKLLETTHVALPRGLRDGVPIYVFVKKNIWNHWMETDTR
jgi:uncharacterized protein (TIGR03663 family)